VRGSRALAIGLLAFATGALIGLDASGVVKGPVGSALARGDFADEESAAALPQGAILTPVLASSTTITSAPPTTAGVAKALKPVISSAALGSDVAVVVADASDGSIVYSVQPTRAQTPASTTKLLTAVTALTLLGPNERLTTKVVDAGSSIVLVGGGDPTLTTTRVRGSSTASLEQLASATATQLLKAKRTSVRVGFDDSLFAAPTTSPSWPATYVSSGVVAPVTALRADGGRVSLRSDARASDPSALAAQRFARALVARGVTVTGAITRTTAPAGAPNVASVQSPPVSDIVETMLTTSDNDAAEDLAHLAGVKAGLGGTFEGGASATQLTLSRLGLPTAGLVLKDGSGLSRDNRVGPTTLAGAITEAARPTQTGLRSTLSGLPVAGFTGTLADRFDTSTTRPGRGVTRGKTGTLTGVSSLAGMVVDASGRPLVFVVMADQVPAGGGSAAEAASDRIASVLASCGCR
jgi:D-alanyl-D-alanine carboxypeptidase/D-alanyl-D-alanine-endopeptidase (penicillin-binding protein 4)